MTTKQVEIKLVAEELPPYNDGSPRWQAGYEIPSESYTNTGWACDDPIHGYLRILSDELNKARNLATALAKDYAVIDALAQEIAGSVGVKLGSPDHPLKYEYGKGFSETRIRQVEEQRNEYQTRLDDLHRCEHGRLCLDDCVGCKGFSVGGSACVIDDQNLWWDKATGKRR